VFVRACEVGVCEEVGWSVNGSMCGSVCEEVYRGMGVGVWKCVCVSEYEGMCGCLKTGKIERLLDFCIRVRLKREREGGRELA
jgi:hypothetical protein